ncbi:F0F1 ATP synthase subunit delta [soil metagenome]
MAENSTVARPYAQALFEVARDLDLEAFAAPLSELAAVSADPQMRAAFSDPLLSDEKVDGLITGIIASPLPEQLRHFVSMLVGNGRVSLLPEIATQFLHLKNEHQGTADAEIVSAFPMDQAQVDDLVAALAKRFGTKLRATVSVDPELIGGVRVTVGDEVLDTTVRARLDQMRVALTA